MMKMILILQFLSDFGFLHSKMSVLIPKMLEYNTNFMINFMMAISVCRAPILFIDMAKISYFNITLSIKIIQNPTFSRFFKIYIIFYNHHKFFVKVSFLNIGTVFTFFDRTINKIINSILT